MRVLEEAQRTGRGAEGRSTSDALSVFGTFFFLAFAAPPLPPLVTLVPRPLFLPRLRWR
jgi:hypothetical protein